MMISNLSSACTRIFTRSVPVGFAAFSFIAMAEMACAHPHVFINAKLEIERNDTDQITEINYVWRFDELFSSSIFLDFDDNGDGKISDDELETVSNTITKNIKEYDYFTAFRKGSEVIEVGDPTKFHAMMDKDNILILTLSVPLKEPVSTPSDDFKISVSDESFYVAFDFTEKDVTFKGGKSKCKNTIEVPDFDRLNEENPDAMTAAFSEDAAKPEFADEYYPWVKVSCS